MGRSESPRHSDQHEGIALAQLVVDQRLRAARAAQGLFPPNGRKPDSMTARIRPVVVVQLLLKGLSDVIQSPRARDEDPALHDIPHPSPFVPSA